MKKFNVKVFGLIFTLLILIGVIYIRGTRYGVIVNNYQEMELKECLSRLNEYEIKEENSFFVRGKDPWLLLDFSAIGNSVVKGLTIKLNQKIDLSNVQIFYGREEENFSEEDSDILSGIGEVVEINSRKALKGFRYIRLDIDTDFCIESIDVIIDYELVYSDKLYKYICMILINLFIAFITAFNVNVSSLLIYLEMKGGKFVKRFLKNRRTVFKRIMILPIIGGIVLCLEFIYHIYSNNDYINIYRVIIFSCIFSIGVYAILYRNICLQYIHIYFFIMALAIGTVTIWTIPVISAMNFDDEIHYSRSADLSWGAKGVVSPADAESMFGHPKIFDHEFRVMWENDINLEAKENPSLDISSKDGPGVRSWTIAYVPSSIGLLLGRGIGISFTNTFRLGKWMNLLCYSLLFSLSIKIVKDRGKILIATFGMIPTNLYMASSYTYDWWVICLIVFGYALYIKEMQLYNKIRTKQLIKILLIILIGILPKLVYFPLLFPIILLSGYKDKKSYSIRKVMIGIMTFLIAVTALFILLRGIGVGDLRGGEGVNVMGQIEFIFTHPLQYIKILLGFLQEYLSPDEASEYLTRMGYYGKAQYWSICLMAIGVSMVLDNRKSNEDIKSVRDRKIVGIGICLVTIIFVVTAIYISFTPVASDTVNGCQHRYIIPVLFPFLYFAGESKIDIKDYMKRKGGVVLLSIMAIVFLYGLYDLRVRYF